MVAQYIKDFEPVLKWGVRMIDNGVNVSSMDDASGAVSAHDMARCMWGFIFMYSSDPLV
jgi:hypothetical protein